MNKKYQLLFILLVFAQVSNAQLFPYNPRAWNVNWTTTEFIDSFNGISLDADKWSVATNFGRGQCVFVDAPGVTYFVENGYLNLKMVNAPLHCYTIDSITKCYNYISAEVTSKETYKYGIYEGCMKFAVASGSWPAFWFFGGSGADDPSYNNGYASEIDIAEYNWYVKLLNYDPKTEHVLHWWGPQGKLPIEGKTKKEASVNWNYWHTFKLIYTPYYLKFYVDGILNWDRSKFYIINGSGQQEEIDAENIDENTTFFEYEGFPMHEGRIILSQQVAGNVAYPFTPQTTLFDWVTYKQFFLSPEITCPEIICSSGIATLDVDLEATNITWQLSPSSLFNTSSGSGLTANITAQSGASGLGTVTYTFEMPGEEEFTAQKTFWVGVPDYQTDGFQIEGGGMGYESPLPCIYYYDNRRYGVHINKSMDGADSHTWEGMVYPGSLYESNFEASFIPMDPGPPYYGSGYVMVRGENTCGSSIPVAIGYGPCGYLLSFTPNPSNNETTLSIESLSKNAEVDESVEWDLEIYDQAQGLKEKKVNLTGKSYRINTSGWIEGVYFVRVKYKDEYISGTLIVKR